MAMVTLGCVFPSEEDRMEPTGTINLLLWPAPEQDLSTSMLVNPYCQPPCTVGTKAFFYFVNRNLARNLPFNFF